MKDEFQDASEALRKRQAEQRDRIQKTAAQKKELEVVHARRIAGIDKRIQTKRLQRRLIADVPQHAILSPSVCYCIEFVLCSEEHGTTLLAFVLGFLFISVSSLLAFPHY